MTLVNTVGALTQRVRRDALLGSSGPVYTLGAAYTAGGTTMTLAQSPNAISTFSTLSIDESLYFVTNVDDVNAIVTVVADYQGSTSTNHALGAIVEVDPRFPAAALTDWAQLEIQSWGSKLWRTRTVDIAVTPNEVAYDLELADAADDVLFLLDTRKEPLGSSTSSSGLTSDRWPHVPARLIRGMATADFPSGYALQLTDRPGWSGNLRVTYATSFNLAAFTSATDLIDDVGLRPSHIDLLEHGVRWRALVSPISARTDWRAAGVSRDGQEVNVLDVIRAADMARSMRDQALAHEGLELRREYPYKDTGM